MKTINVEGLPEPIVRSFEAMVQTVREEMGEAEKPRQRVELPVWSGEILCALTREEIYKDVGSSRFDARRGARLRNLHRAVQPGQIAPAAGDDLHGQDLGHFVRMQPADGLFDPFV